MTLAMEKEKGLDVTLTKKAFLPALQQVVKVIQRKSTIPVLQCVLIEKVSGGIHLTGYDLKDGIRRFVPLESLDLSDDSGERIAVEARTLLEIIKRLGETIHMHHVGETVVLESEGTRFELSTVDDRDYPSLPLDELKGFPVEGSLIIDLAAKTVPAASTELVRPVLTGVQWSITSDGIRVISTDSHRLHRCIRPLAGAAEAVPSAVVSAKTMMTLAQIVEEDETYQVGFAKNHLYVKGEEFVFLSRLLDGTYPETSRIFTNQFKLVFTVEREELINALEQLQILGQTVVMETHETGIRMTSIPEGDKRGAGKCKVELPNVHMQGSPIRIGFNSKYVVDALRVIEAPEVTWSFTGAMTPFILQGVNTEQDTFLILPVRLAE